jgi:hypothetical protein
MLIMLDLREAGWVGTRYEIGLGTAIFTLF